MPCCETNFLQELVKYIPPGYQEDDIERLAAGAPEQIPIRENPLIPEENQVVPQPPQVNLVLHHQPARYDYYQELEKPYTFTSNHPIKEQLAKRAPFLRPNNHQDVLEELHQQLREEGYIPRHGGEENNYKRFEMDEAFIGPKKTKVVDGYGYVGKRRVNTWIGHGCEFYKDKEVRYNWVPQLLKKTLIIG